MSIERQGSKTKAAVKLFAAVLMAVAMVAQPFLPVAGLGQQAFAVAGTTETVKGNTSAGENQPGWMFNRDASTSTPFEFNTSAHSLGNGSLYVKPIGLNPSGKFVGELFDKTPVSELNSIAYDFQIGAGGSVTDANQFYLNIYANFDSSDKYYDCRFDYVPTAGAVGSFTAATFDKTATPVSVKKGSGVSSCPATLAGMPTGSYVRAFAVSVGDTTASDIGLDGYLDNVVVNKTGGATTYDFEPDTAAPSVPTGGLPHGGFSGTNNFYFTWNESTDDQPGNVSYEFQSSTNGAQSGGILTTGLWKSGILPDPTIHSTGAPDGKWYWQVRAIDVAGNKSAWSPVWNITLDTLKPAAPVLMSPGNGVSVEGDNLVHDWQDVEGAHHYVYQSFNVKSDGSCNMDSKRFSGEGYVFNSSKTGARDVADLTFCWRVKAVDAAGNSSNWSDLWKTVVDNAPAKPKMLGIYKGHNSDVENLLECNGFTNTNKIRIAWKENSESDIAYYWLGTKSNTKHKKVTGKTYYDGSMTPGNNPYYYTVIAVDAAGNESEISEQCGLILDTVAPVITNVTPAYTEPVSGEQEFKFTITEDWPKRITVKLNGDDYIEELTASPTSVVPNDFDFSGVIDLSVLVDTTSLQNGTNTLTVEAEDQAGNPVASYTLNFEVLNVPQDETEEPNEGGQNFLPQGTNSTPQPITPLTLTVSNAAFFTAVADTNSDDENDESQDSEESVLGTTTDKNNGGADKVAVENAASQGMAWYWWTVIVLGAILAWFAIAAASRKLRGNES